MESDGLCLQFVMEIAHENLAIAHLSGIFLSFLLIPTVKGAVTDYLFINPHVLISVEVKNDKGRIEKWMAEANSPNVLSRHGWSKEIIKPGDQITVIGNRAKNGSTTLRLQKVVLSNGQELDPNSLQD